MTLLYLNLDDPQVSFFQDLNIRKALMQGLNRQAMIDNLLNGQAILADGPIFPGTWAYYDGIEHYVYDQDQAIALLREAGFTLPASGGESAPAKMEQRYPSSCCMQMTSSMQPWQAPSNAIGQPWESRFR